MSNTALSLSETLPPEVRTHVHWTKEGGLQNTPHNWMVILKEDPRMAGRLMHNSFANKAVFDGKEVNDNCVMGIALWMARNYHINPRNIKLLASVVDYAAQAAGKFDPLRDYFNSLPAWDKTKRIDTFLSDGMGAAKTHLIRRISRCFFLAACRRGMNPGTKVDEILILQGKQRMGKSTAAAALCPDPAWFSSSQSNLKIGDRDAVYCIQGKFIFEIAELDSFRGKSATQLKAFFSETVDRVRPVHGAYFEDLPRRTIFIGTTNEMSFLRDYTGNRRYRPVIVQKVDVKYITDNRDQLWAEALHGVNAGEPHWFSDDDEDSLEQYNERFQEIDPWEEPISQYMEGYMCPTMVEVLQGALGMKLDKIDKRCQLRAAAILRRLGYASKQTRAGGTRKQVWVEVNDGS